MSFIILKHTISLETTFLEFSDFSLDVLSLWLSDWRTETVGLILSASYSNWTDQFLRLRKLSFRSLFFCFLLHASSLPLACDVLIISMSLCWSVIIMVGPDRSCEFLSVDRTSCGVRCVLVFFERFGSAESLCQVREADNWI